MRAGFVDADEVNAEFNAETREDVGSCQKTLVVALDVGLSPLVDRLEVVILVRFLEAVLPGIVVG